MVINSKHVSGVTTKAQAIEWTNGVSAGSADYKIMKAK